MQDRCLSVVVPVYNEERTLPVIVSKLLALPQLLEIVIVDDCSTDGTQGIISELRARHDEIQSARHDRNRGKTEALKTAFRLTKGEIVIVQDADLEYDPGEIPSVIEPILEGNADVVFGSRFLVRKASRALYFYHYVGNKLLTLLSNLATNINLTDVETGYKAFRGDIIRQLKITSHGFGFEIEVIAKVAKLKCSIYETPISYYGRTYEEGKKITAWDGLAALYYIIRYNFFSSLKNSYFSIPQYGLARDIPSETGGKVWWLVIAAIGIWGIASRAVGLDRSLWLDEAWVANSVTAKSLAGMFWYDPWLQTSPPLFLLLVRMTVGSLGLTAIAFRLVPFLSGLVAMGCMFALARRILALRYAVLAWTLFVSSYVAIYYSTSLKQYSLELAASTAVILICILYLEHPTIRRYWVLLAVVAAGLLAAYPVAFLLPGVVLLVLAQKTFVSPASTQAPPIQSGLTRAILLSAVSCAILIGIYVLFVRSNTSPSLHDHFAWGSGDSSYTAFTMAVGYKLLYIFSLPHSLLKRKIAVYCVLGLLSLGGIILSQGQLRRGRGKWMQVQILCALPCLILTICGGLTWYPSTSRTSLFLLPAITLLLVSDLQLILDFATKRYRPRWLDASLDIAVVCIVLLLILEGVKLSRTFMKSEEEDVAAAVSYLRSNVQHGDLLWVHATVSEQFKLYAKMTGWSDPPVQFGHTGWPCCPRGIPVFWGSGRNEDVRSDLNRGTPAKFSGKAWLLYTTRQDQWRGVGAYQPKMMEDFFRERGCLQQPSAAFQNIGISSFDCGAPHSQIAGRCESR